MLLMIDNYDSFTFNLVQYFGELGEEVRSFRNDEIDVAGIGALRPDAIVLLARALHAGRGRHLRRRDPRLRRQAADPRRLPRPPGDRRRARRQGGSRRRLMHGKADVLSHDGRGVYAGLPESFSVIRYHSLALERESLPRELEITSTASDGEIMGVRHRELAATKAPLEGVQFHPESILTEHGHAMLKNFLEAAR